MTLTFAHYVPAFDKVQHLTAPEGTTIAGMAAAIGASKLVAYVATSDGRWEEVPRALWERVRPRRDGVVRFYARAGLSGGGGQLLALVATVAIAIAAPYLGGVIAGALGFTAGTTAFTAASSLFAAGIGIGGSLLLSALFPAEPQVAATTQADDRQKRATFENVQSDGNLLARDAFPPRIFGEARISPPDAAHPDLYLDKGVQAVNRVLVASGRYDISDVRVDGTLAEDMPAIALETRDGGPGTTTRTFVDRVTAPVPVGAELGSFALDDVDLEDQDEPSNSSPVPIRFKTRAVDDMIEISIRLRVDALIKTTDPTVAVRQPLHIRYRPDGGDDGDWVNLPGIHLKGIERGTRLLEVRIRRDGAFGNEDIGGSISYELWSEEPEVTAWPLADGSTGLQWAAHSNFRTGAIQDDGAGHQDVKNVVARRHGIRVTATKDIFPVGAYEFEISRGIVTDADWMGGVNHKKSGEAISLFVARNEGTSQNPEWKVPVAQADYPTRVTVSHCSVIAEVPPVQQPGTAVIALKSRSQSIRNVSAIFKGYAMDWDGAGWVTPVATRNPALHTRQLLDDVCRHFRVAQYSRLPRIAAMAKTVLENTDWIGWRDQCIRMGASCSLVAAGETITEVLSLLLASGLARPAFGAKLRIDYFRDLSGEEPAITFSPRNGSSIRMIYENPRRPMGVRATFRNRNLDWANDELEVRAPISGNMQNWRGMESRAIDDPDWLRQRLTFDQLRAYWWRTRYEVTNEIENQALKPGTLIGLVTDLVDDTAHGARVRDVANSQQLVLDQVIPAVSTLVGMDEIGAGFDYADLFEVGEQSVIQVLTPSGSELKTIVDADTDSGGFLRVVLDSALASEDVLGQHVSIGSLSNQIRRCIVVDDDSGRDFQRTIVAADERHKEIYQTMADQFGWAA